MFGSRTFRTGWKAVRCLCQQRAAFAAAASGESTVDKTEIIKFARLASKWWDHSGEFAALHSMNKLRVPLITNCLPHRAAGELPLSGAKVLDVGCGGGILSMPITRLGGNVTGLDATAENIDVANAYVKMLNEPVLSDNLTFVCSTVEDFSKNHTEEFDIVVASEVVEHVHNLPAFINACVKMVKPGGSLVFTTLNRTQRSYWLAIVAAENIARIVPQGTHDWHKFITPDELKKHLEKEKCKNVYSSGMVLNPITLNWSWNSDKSINYVMTFTKQPRNSNLSPDAAV